MTTTWFSCARALVPALAAFVTVLGACSSASPVDDASPRDAAAPPDAAAVDDAGPTADAADAGQPACRAASVGPIPNDAGDVTYAYSGTPPGCFSHPLCQIACAAGTSFVEALLACAPVQGGYYWGQGSSYIRVHGIAGGRCVYDVGLEVEDGTTYEQCSAPLPVQAWSGLSAYDANGLLQGGTLATGLEGCVTLLGCGPQGCKAPDGGLVEDGGFPASVPICPDVGDRTDGC